MHTIDDAASDAATSAQRASLHRLLSYAWDVGAFATTDAVAATGLTRSTVIDALDELIERGLLRELPNARAVGEYSKGRPSRRYELKFDAAVVVGMDAGAKHLMTTVADLRGHTLAQTSIELDPDADRVDAVLGALDSTLAVTGRSRGEALAVCVGVPAPVNGRGISPDGRDDFWKRMNPQFQDVLERSIPIVRIHNDASLAALAEGSVGAAVGLRDYVVLLAGDRLGAGVVVDGLLLRGTHGGVGEMKAFDYVFGVGTAEGIGFQLEGWVREAALAGEIPEGHPFLAAELSQLTAREVLQLAHSGDTWARGLVERAGAFLARITAVFGSLYDPQRVIVTGAVAEGLGDVADVARRILPAQLDLPAPELVLSSLGAGSVVAGAVSGAVSAARADVLRIGLPSAAAVSAGAR